MAKRTTRKATREADPRARVIDAALALAARDGWRRVTLADIAAEAKVALADLAGMFRSKAAIVAALARRIDSHMRAGADADLADQPARDRLFELLMLRLDGLAPHREGVRAVARGTCDPLAAGRGGATLLCSMALTLEAAGISAAGLAGLVRTKGLAAIYLSVLRRWLRDGDTESAMARLDKQLDRADRLIARLCRARRPTESDAEASA